MLYMYLSITPHPSPTRTRKSEKNLIADRTKPELVQWYHATLFIPVKYNLLQDIKNGLFYTWKKLTIDLIYKHLSL